ncbi:hypothetical protein [Kitasatospora phosalacinea]|uniref:hypothetical protein n=1 Tax=Kitasatospora phosalacinea TaxID=2065 RepID=UPI0005266708|nr:hypothetical protein [Kitasatospora phosalacinea]
MFKTGRVLLAATSVALLALTATACNDNETDDSPAAAASKGGDSGAGSGAGKSGAQGGAVDTASLLKLVSEKTTAAKSAKVEVTNEMGDSKTSMKGALSWEKGLQGEMSGGIGGGAMADSLAKAGSDGKMSARYLSDAMYVNMGDAMAGQLGGAHWIKYGYADLTKLMGPAGDSLKNQLQNADPISSVRALIASGQVTKAGTEKVNGTEATKYTGDLGAAEITAATSKGLTQDQIDALEEQFTAAGISTEHIEIWISKDNLLLKKIEQFDSKAGQVVSTALYSDYGTPIKVSAPPASDTVDFAELMKGQQAGS